MIILGLQKWKGNDFVNHIFNRDFHLTKILAFRLITPEAQISSISKSTLYAVFYS